MAAVLRQARVEGGTSLILALAFLALLGVFTSAILMVADANFKTTQVVRGRIDALYAADGGIDYAIETVRSDATYCENAAAGIETLPAKTLNNNAVTITCQTTSGTTGSGSPGPTTWPLVITGYNGLQSTTSFKTSGSTGKANTFTFGNGPVFNAGGFSFSNASDKVIFSGDLHQYNTNNYCTNAKAAAIKPQINGIWTCETAATYPVPDPNPTIIVPTVTAPGFKTVGTCTIFYPGKYTSANEPVVTSGTGHYYFASGVYYFENVGTMPMNGDVFGGEPRAPDTQKFTVVNPCATDAVANAQTGRAGASTGDGVEFIFGGTSRLDPTTNASSKIELFARQPAVPANEGTAGLSLYASSSTFPNYVASTVEPISLGGNPDQLVIHGLVYAPNASFKIWSMANAGAGNAPMFGGGLVAGALEVALNGSSITSTFATVPAGTPASTRTMTLTATAFLTGEAPTTETAVISLGTTAGAPPTILSWRKS